MQIIRIALTLAFFDLLTGPTAQLLAATQVLGNYGDGSGMTTEFVVYNPTEITVDATLNFYDSNGKLQALPFQSGDKDIIPMKLAPFVTVSFRTQGTSNPLRAGFAMLVTDSPKLVGMAIFRYQGDETTVLPVRLAEAFLLYVQRSSAVDTGIAVVRGSAQSRVYMRLKDDLGVSVRFGYFPFESNEQRHCAMFLSELFPGLPADFRGTLSLSDTDASSMAALGLRQDRVSGGLSTIPLQEDRPLVWVILDGMLGLWTARYTDSAERTVRLATAQVKASGVNDYFAEGYTQDGHPFHIKYDPGNKEFRLLVLEAVGTHRFQLKQVEEARLTGCHYWTATGSPESPCHPVTAERDGR